MFTIATNTNETYGYGSSGSEQRICREGNYGTGDFPPLFNSRVQAEKYLSNIEFKYDKVVVEMKVAAAEE